MGRTAFPDPGSEIKRPRVSGLVECVMVMGYQRVDYSEAMLALSSADLGALFVLDVGEGMCRFI